MKMSLKALRINAGLKVVESAKNLNISPDTLTNYETGKMLPRIDTVLAMMNLYKCEFDDIDFLLQK